MSNNRFDYINILACPECTSFGYTYDIDGIHSKMKNLFSVVYSDGFHCSTNICTWGANYTCILFECSHCQTPLWKNTCHIYDITLKEKEAALDLMCAQNWQGKKFREDLSDIENRIINVFPDIQQVNALDWDRLTTVLETELNEEQEAYCRKLF